MMRTVHEVSKLAGVSVRTLRYYDKIGLLHPSDYSQAGYRLYDDNDLEKLRQILLFRELEFPLRDICNIVNSPDFDKEQALRQQIELLTLKKEHIENLLIMAREISEKGTNTMDFTPFDKKKIEEYSARAKAEWGSTSEYREFEQKNAGRTDGQRQNVNVGLMAIFSEFAAIKDGSPSSDEAFALVKKLQNYITENYYACSDTVLAGLGKMYGCGGEFTENINKAAGDGTAEFAASAIESYFSR